MDKNMGIPAKFSILIRSKYPYIYLTLDKHISTSKITTCTFIYGNY
jgi:hypothetical protein